MLIVISITWNILYEYKSNIYKFIKLSFTATIFNIKYKKYFYTSSIL